MIYLQQELELSWKLLEALEQEKRLELEFGGAVSDMCIRHIQFARGLQERIRDRRALLETVLELLTDSDGKMGEAVAGSVELLDAGSIATMS